MTRAQVLTFLAAGLGASTAYERRPYPPLVLARTGTRLGEALALQWDDVDFGAHDLGCAGQGLSADCRVKTPKSGHGRTVDMSDQLARALLRLHVERKVETFGRGWPQIPRWIFCTSAVTPLDESKVRRVFGKMLKAAGLPPHFTPHSLRHTFASLLLQQGESPAHVQRQLGHASIRLTVDTYERCLPMGNNKAAVNRLDDRSGSKTVTSEGSGDAERPGSA